MSSKDGKRETHGGSPNQHGKPILRAIDTDIQEQLQRKTIKEVSSFMKELHTPNTQDSAKEEIEENTRSSFIEVSVMGKSMLMLVDTGSTHTLLSHDYASRMRLLPKEMKKIKTLLLQLQMVTASIVMDK